ncbi:MAG: dihydrofolate reductase [Candidatus Methanoperedens sp.]|nr:dihydrofolate reductase [Candidatus Methanoperedens sp.]
MSKTILYIAASLDGYIAGPDDDISWLSPYQGIEYGYEEFLAKIGAVIKGRRTYDIEVRNGWENAFSIPQFVLSKNKPELPRPGVTFTNEDIAQVLQKIKQITDKDIWIEGGANVARQFINRGLLDEIILTIVPVILGDGIRLFDNIHKRRNLLLTDVMRFDKGLVQLIYSVG